MALRLRLWPTLHVFEKLITDLSHKDAVGATTVIDERVRELFRVVWVGCAHAPHSSQSVSPHFIFVPAFVPRCLIFGEFEK